MYAGPGDRRAVRVVDVLDVGSVGRAVAVSDCRVVADAASREAADDVQQL